MSNLLRNSVVVFCLLLGVPAGPAAQERAPNGQVYGELLPFVRLDGVRVQVRGITGIIYNFREPGEEPIRKSRGMDRKQMDDLQDAIEADIAEAFRRGGVPLLDGPPQTHPEVRPLLVVDLLWSTPCSGEDLFVLTTKTELLEAARPLSDPTKIVWTVSWGQSSRRTVVRSDLARQVRSGTSVAVSEFLTLYARAHAR